MSDLSDQAEQFIRKLNNSNKPSPPTKKNFRKPTCAYSGKIQYRTVKRVLNAINQIDNGASHYKCKHCHQYHLTSSK